MLGRIEGKTASIRLIGKLVSEHTGIGEISLTGDSKRRLPSPCFGVIFSNFSEFETASLPACAFSAQEET